MTTQCYIFIAAPYDIVITPVHIDVAIGSTFSATCTAKGDPAPTYSWFFKDQMIQTGQQLSITGSATTDDGVYTCVATNSLGIRQANMDANVRCKFYIYIYLCVHAASNNYEKKFKQWSSAIPPISTKRTITSHRNSLNTTKMGDNNIWRWKSRSCLEHALKCVIKEWCIYKCVVISPLVIQHTYVSLP